MLRIVRRKSKKEGKVEKGTLDLKADASNATGILPKMMMTTIELLILKLYFSKNIYNGYMKSYRRKGISLENISLHVH